MRVCVSVPLQGVSDGYKHGASSFFAIYRFDFMLDQQLRPYIMEVLPYCYTLDCFDAVECSVAIAAKVYQVGSGSCSSCDWQLTVLGYVDQYVSMCTLTMLYNVKVHITKCILQVLYMLMCMRTRAH